jgi:uncharacterized protein
MATSIIDIEELQALRSPNQIVRVPPEIDIAVTARVLRIIDTAVFRRLAQVSQLGLVALVYPGATHSRFEHSLGVYRNACLFLQRLGSLPEFQAACSIHEAELLIVGSLLHDIGHWPFAHAIEDMQLPGMPRHENMARELLDCNDLRNLLKQDWDIDIAEISELLAPAEKSKPRFPLLGTILSGPIDIDKLDYLDRDSLHAGVPYGRNFDRHRLITQLCLGPDHRSLAITDKARTAAEMMVFARYVMFSEVYWHHAVRSATSMLQRTIWEFQTDWLQQHKLASEAEFINQLVSSSRGKACRSLVDGLFGARRQLYKRLAEFHRLAQPEIHQSIARRSYSDLVILSEKLTRQLAKKTGFKIEPLDVLIDAPPVKLEVQFSIRVRQASGNFLLLGELSPVADTLANQQFDNLVKRVRIFVKPELRDSLRTVDIVEAIQATLEA